MFLTARTWRLSSPRCHRPRGGYAFKISQPSEDPGPRLRSCMAPLTERGCDLEGYRRPCSCSDSVAAGVTADTRGRDEGRGGAGGKWGDSPATLLSQESRACPLCPLLLSPGQGPDEAGAL